MVVTTLVAFLHTEMKLFKLLEAQHMSALEKARHKSERQYRWQTQVENTGSIFEDVVDGKEEEKKNQDAENAVVTNVVITDRSVVTTSSHRRDKQHDRLFEQLYGDISDDAREFDGSFDINEEDYLRLDFPDLKTTLKIQSMTNDVYLDFIEALAATTINFQCICFPAAMKIHRVTDCFHALENQHNCKKLIFSGIQIQQEHAQAEIVRSLCTFMHGSQETLEFVDVSWNYFRDDDMSILMTEMAACKNMQHIDVSFNPDMDDNVIIDLIVATLLSPPATAAAAADMFENKTKEELDDNVRCNLRTLRCSGCGITMKGAQTLASSLLGGRLEHLTCLDLSSNSLGSYGVALIANSLHLHAKSLEELSLSYTFTAKRETDEDDEGVQGLSRMFDVWKEQPITLTSFSLAGCGLNKKNARGLFERLRGIPFQSLDLSDNDLDE